MRLAARVGSRADRVAGQAGLRQPGSATRAADLARLAALASVPVDVLEALAYQPAGRFAHHRFGAGLLHRDMLDLASRRICPACLDRSTIHRRAWHVALLTACPDHAIRLVDRCPRCRRHLGWADTSVDTCRCGSEVKSWPRSSVTAHESLACGRLLELANAAECGWLPDVLRECDPGDLLQLAMSLGLFLTGWPKVRRPETLVDVGPEAVAHVVIAGIGALVDWPRPLLAFLEGERHRASERSGRYGAAKVLGPFYGWVRDVEPGLVKDAVLAAVQKSIASDPVGVHRMHRSKLLSRGRVAKPAVVNLRQAADMLGRSTTTTKRMLAQARLADAQPAGRGVPTALDGAEVLALAHTEEGKLTLLDVAGRLGVAKIRTRLILEAGFIAVRNPASDAPSGRWSVDTAAVDAFLSGMQARVVPRPQERLGGFDYAVEALRRRGIDMVAILRRVQEASLCPAGVDEAAVGIKRLMFARCDIVALCAASSPSRLLTVQEAARHLGLKWQVVDHLVRRRILTRTPEGIPASAIDRFTAGFVTGAELARVRKTSPRALAASLAKAGIVPVSGPGVDGGRQNFYARDVG